MRKKVTPLSPDSPATSEMSQLLVNPDGSCMAWQLENCLKIVSKNKDCAGVLEDCRRTSNLALGEKSPAFGVKNVFTKYYHEGNGKLCFEMLEMNSASQNNLPLRVLKKSPKSLFCCCLPAVFLFGLLVRISVIIVCLFILIFIWTMSDAPAFRKFFKAADSRKIWRPAAILWYQKRLFLGKMQNSAYSIYFGAFLLHRLVKGFLILSYQTYRITGRSFK